MIDEVTMVLSSSSLNNNTEIIWVWVLTLIWLEMMWDVRHYNIDMILFPFTERPHAPEVVEMIDKILVEKGWPTAIVGDEKCYREAVHILEGEYGGKACEEEDNEYGGGNCEKGDQKVAEKEWIYLENKETGFVLEIKDCHLDEGASIILGKKTEGNASQLWKYENSCFKSKLDENFVLDVDGGCEDTERGTRVHLWTSNGTDAQKWVVGRDSRLESCLKTERRLVLHAKRVEDCHVCVWTKLKNKAKNVTLQQWRVTNSMYS